MDDEAEVLRFRPREGFEDHDDDDADREYRVDEPYDVYDGYRGYGRASAGGLGQLTKVVLIGDQVVDVVRRPVSGSGYECAALELRYPGPGAGPRSEPPPVPEPPAHERQLAWLARIVGGEDELARLGVAPLEPEDLRLEGVPQRLHARLRGIDTRLEQWAPVLLGDEGLTAGRRLLTRAVTLEPSLVTRSDRDDMATAAVLWAVAKGNDLVGTNRPLRASVIQDVCGLRSSPSGRGSAFAHAVGAGHGAHGRPLWMFHVNPDVIPLGSPGLLLSRFRRHLVLERDLALQLRARTSAP